MYSFFFISATNIIIIHLSPNGEDQPSCGTLAQKCRTIDHALNQTKHRNITVVFQASSTESLKYNLTKPLHRNDESVFLRFTKDDQKGINPTIYGRNISFVSEIKGGWFNHDQI